MMSLQSLLQNVQAIELKEDVKLALVLEAADEQSRAVIEAGAALLQQEGLELAAEFVSRNMTRMLRDTRAKLMLAPAQAELGLAA